MTTQRKDDEESLFQKVRLSEIVLKFDGKGDVVAWIQQVRIAKRIMQLADADLADLASLALKGKAFAVYQEMPPGKRADFEEIAEALMTAFAEDKLSAQAAASERKYMEGEGVDAYLNKLKRLGRIAKASEDTIQCWFILGLPTEVAEQFRATPKVHSLPQEMVLEDGQGNGAPGREQKGGISSIGSCKGSRSGWPDKDEEGLFRVRTKSLRSQLPRGQERDWTADRKALWHGKTARRPTAGRNRWPGLRPVGVPAVSPGRRGISSNNRSRAGKRIWAVVGATFSPVLGSQGQLQQVSSVVIRTIRVNGQECNGLIDTGCSKNYFITTNTC